MKEEKITFRLSETEKEQLKLIAKEKDVPVSQLIRQGVREIIQKETK